MLLPEGYRTAGIELNYVKKRQTLTISGWYDSFVGIEPTQLTLAQFFKRLGITEQDCRLAFQKDSIEGGEQ
jgi:hypothetical protein